MKKKEFIGRRGEAAYERMQDQSREWQKANQKLVSAKHKRWMKTNPDRTIASHKKWEGLNQEKRKAIHQAQGCKMGKHYERHRIYNHTGLQGERNKVRNSHGRRWREYKNIIAPGSQLHHQWLPGKSEYSGLALVEADLHMHGIIDVIQVLDGEITVFTEKELREGGEM